MIPPQESEPLTTYSTGSKNVLVFLIDDVLGKLKNSKVQLKCTSLIDGNQHHTNSLKKSRSQTTKHVWLARD